MTTIANATPTITSAGNSVPNKPFSLFSILSIILVLLFIFLQHHWIMPHKERQNKADQGATKARSEAYVYNTPPYTVLPLIQNQQKNSFYNPCSLCPSRSVHNQALLHH